MQYHPIIQISSQCPIPSDTRLEQITYDLEQVISHYPENPFKLCMNFFKIKSKHLHIKFARIFFQPVQIIHQEL
jgi:hypothetical protein